MASFGRYDPHGYGPGCGRYGGDDSNPRRPPEQSPTYGRRGDQAVQRWARRRGYDTGFQI